MARVCGDGADPQLVMVAPESEETRKLREVWDSILVRDRLRASIGGVDVIDGERVIWHGHQWVRTGEEEYVWGIYDALYDEYGYYVR